MYISANTCLAGRAYTLLIALLPENLRSLVPQATNKAAFFSALTSGQCLCAAYNTGVRRSRKPWGFISVDSIHDIASLEQSSDGADGEEKGKIGWTFRRIDNLRLWAAYVSEPLRSNYSLTYSSCSAHSSFVTSFLSSSCPHPVDQTISLGLLLQRVHIHAVHLPHVLPLVTMRCPPCLRMCHHHHRRRSAPPRLSQL